MEIGLPAMLLGAFCVIAYGWMLDYTSSPAGPIVCISILGYGLVTSAQVLNVLMVDI
jgi:cell division septal protein FtsQ